MTYGEFKDWLDSQEYSDPNLARLQKLFREDRKRDAGREPYPVNAGGGLRTPKFCTPTEYLNEITRARGEPRWNGGEWSEAITRRNPRWKEIDRGGRGPRR